MFGFQRHLHIFQGRGEDSMASLDERLKMMSESVAAKKAATAPRSTQDVSLVLDAALYDWIERLDEGEGSAAMIEHEKRRIQRNFENIDRLSDKERSADVFKLLAMREFGSVASFTFQYMCACLPLANTIKSSIYMSLSLIEPPGCIYPDDTLSTILADIESGYSYAMRWLASTHAIFPQVTLDKFMLPLKKTLRGVFADGMVVERAMSALVHLLRTHPTSMQLDDFSFS